MADDLTEWTVREDRSIHLDRHSDFWDERIHVPQTAAAAAGLLFDPEPAAPALVGSWLLPGAGVAPDEERTELAGLLDWCSAADGPTARLVIGASGQGKTHLARQLCERHRAAGRGAGFVRLPPPAWPAAKRSAPLYLDGLRRTKELIAGVVALAELGAGALLVVDYPGGVGTMAAELLDLVARAGAGHLVRVLLLARTEGCFPELAGRDERVDPEPVVLGPLHEGRIGEIWSRAVEAFRVRAGLTHAPAAEPAFTGGTTLDLYADALRAALGGVGDPVEAVLTYERRQILRDLNASGAELSGEHLDWALAALALHPPGRPGENSAPGPAFCPPGHVMEQRVAACLHKVLPEGPQVPDRLTAGRLLDLAARARSAQHWHHDLAELCAAEDDAVARYAFAQLHRCLAVPDADPAGRARIESGLDELLRDRPGTFAPAAIITDPVAYCGRVIALAGDERPAMSELEAGELSEVLIHLGAPATYAATAVAVSRRVTADLLVSRHPKFLDLHSLRHERDLLAQRLVDLGDHEAAVQSQRDGLAIFDRQAREDPDRAGDNVFFGAQMLAWYAYEYGDDRAFADAAELAVATCRRYDKRVAEIESYVAALRAERSAVEPDDQVDVVRAVPGGQGAHRGEQLV